MKRISVFVVGFGMAGSLGTGASAAVADTVEAATAAEYSIALPSQGREVVRGKYWTRAACIAAGKKGAAEGRWSRYHCTEGAAFWVLWTDR